MGAPRLGWRALFLCVCWARSPAAVGSGDFASPVSTRARATLGGRATETLSSLWVLAVRLSSSWADGGSAEFRRCGHVIVGVQLSHQLWLYTNRPLSSRFRRRLDGVPKCFLLWMAAFRPKPAALFSPARSPSTRRASFASSRSNPGRRPPIRSTHTFVFLTRCDRPAGGAARFSSAVATGDPGRLVGSTGRGRGGNSTSPGVPS